MRIGFEVTAAKPKGTKAAEEQPAQTPMRPREIAKAPSTDQKRVRRQMQRSAAMNDVGDCRLCGGDLKPTSHEGSTTKAACTDCGTEHTLQSSEVKKVSALAYEAFQNLPVEEKERLEAIADLQMEAWYPPGYPKVNCPHCGASKGRQGHEGNTSGNLAVKCEKCKGTYQVNRETGLVPDANPDRDLTGAQRKSKYPEQYADTPEYAERSRKNREQHDDYGHTATRKALLVALVGSTWVPVVDTSRYLSAPHLSAIARRAQSVLDTEETQ